MKDDCNERFFEELAKAYAEKDGIALKKEFSRIESTNDLSGLEPDRKNSNARINFRSFRMKALTVAASIVIAVLSYNVYKVAFQSDSVDSNGIKDTQGTEDTLKALRYSVELVSAGLPSGYALTAVDYDNAAAIMEITNSEKNRIVLVTEKYHDFSKEGFSEITINGMTVHGIIKNDYCILKYEKDDMLYTFTGLYGFSDLIKISENFL